MKKLILCILSILFCFTLFTPTLAHAKRQPSRGTAQQNQAKALKQQQKAMKRREKQQRKAQKRRQRDAERANRRLQEQRRVSN